MTEVHVGIKQITDYQNTIGSPKIYFSIVLMEVKVEMFALGSL